MYCFEKEFTDISLCVGSDILSSSKGAARTQTDVLSSSCKLCICLKPPSFIMLYAIKKGRVFLILLQVRHCTSSAHSLKWLLI